MSKDKKKRKGKVEGAIPPPPPIRSSAEDMTLEMFEVTIGTAVRNVMTTPTIRKVIANAVHKATKEALAPQVTSAEPPKEDA